jgi:ABC-type multidrug transport system fused ATPase/permease subunit
MKTYKKILELLSNREKKNFFIIIFLTLVTAILDMLGVASILPFLALIINPKLIETDTIFINLYKTSSIIGVDNSTQFIFFFGLLIFFYMIFSLIFRTITHYLQVRFALMCEYSIGKRLLEIYLNQPYRWFLNKNSTELTKNILSETHQVINFAITPIMSFISHSLAATTIIFLLIVISPKIAIIAGFILIITYFFIFFSVKNFLDIIGSQRAFANTNRFAIIKAVFSSIKEVKFIGLENFYIDKFSKPSKIYANNQSLASVIGSSPRNIIEGISFGALIILVLTLIQRGNNIEKIIPTVALFIFAAYRLLPAFQQIYLSITQLRFANHGLDLLHADFKNLRLQEDVLDVPLPRLENNFITLNNINFYHQNKDKLSLSNINLSIPFFNKVAFCGQTGSGKTTLIDIILGLHDSAEGTLSIDGNIINKKTKKSWQKIIGYVPQSVNLVDDSVINNIAIGIKAGEIDYKLAEECAKLAHIHDFIKELPNGYNTHIEENGARLSGGQKQRLGIARALYQKPKILIMDEATNSLDSVTEKNIMQSLDENFKKKITIILVAHRLNLLKECNTIFFLEKGCLKAQGTYRELSETNDDFKRMIEIGSAHNNG